VHAIQQVPVSFQQRSTEFVAMLLYRWQFHFGLVRGDDLESCSGKHHCTRSRQNARAREPDSTVKELGG
jgi:hypothetical protein